MKRNSTSRIIYKIYLFRGFVHRCIQIFVKCSSPFFLMKTFAFRAIENKGNSWDVKYLNAKSFDRQIFKFINISVSKIIYIYPISESAVIISILQEYSTPVDN